MEHNDQVNSFQKRARRQNVCLGRFDERAEQGSSGIHPSSHQEQHGDTTMSNAHLGLQVRYTPYAIRPYQRRGNRHYGDHIHANMDMKREGVLPEKEMEQDRAQRRRLKITTAFGIKCDKTRLLNLIQNQRSIPFTRVDAQFFAENPSIASALKTINCKIWDQLNEKISILMIPSVMPDSVQKELKSEEEKQPKQAVNKQYGDSEKVFECQKLHSDPDLVTHDKEMALNPRKDMDAFLKMHEVNTPKLLVLKLRKKEPHQPKSLSDTMQRASDIKNMTLSKSESVGHVDKVKGPEPERMCADRKALSTIFPDKSTDLSSILELFPRVLHLDGQELPSPITAGIKGHKKLPTCQGSFFGSETLKSLVLQFLQQYFLICDYRDRQSLLRAYHDQACFSLTTPFISHDTAPSSLNEYFKISRNIKELKDPDLRVQLLKHTKCDIVDSLSVLPKTQHDLGSFVVDVCIPTKTMLCFSVSGLFQEVEGKSQGSVRAFTRTFITTPGSNSSLCIMNEELFVRNPSPQMTQTSWPSCMPTISQEQQEMVKAFSMQSEMNLQWCQKCLQDNDWNYTRAVKFFTDLKAEGKIVEDTFMQ